MIPTWEQIDAMKAAVQRNRPIAELAQRKWVHPRSEEKNNVMTLQEMHEAICAKRGCPVNEFIFRLSSRLDGRFRAGWFEGSWGEGATMQDAIDAAFKLAMEDR